MKWKKSSARPAKNWRNSKPSAARCRPNGSSARKNASPSWRRIFYETQKRLEGEVARLDRRYQGPRLRAQIEKQSGRRLGKIAGEARAEADAAVVETLAASQADLGVAARSALPSRLRRSSSPPGQRVIVKGFKQPRRLSPPRRPHRRSRSGPAADEGSARRISLRIESDAANPSNAGASTAARPAASPFTPRRATSPPPKKST